MEKRLLLVDNEDNIRNAIKRLCRREKISIQVAQNAVEALSILKESPVDVILSDHRLAGASGVQLLRDVKQLYPNVIRMMISAYTDLNSLADAINDSAIFKYVFKPWDDEQLLAAIEEAFSISDLRTRNEELNNELKALNADLEKKVEEKTRSLQLHIRSLNTTRELFNVLPFMAIGISEDDFVVEVNRSAEEMLGISPLVGLPPEDLLPDELFRIFNAWRDTVAPADAPERHTIKLGDKQCKVILSSLTSEQKIRGYLISGELI